jgi:diaminopimelate epimerase
MELNFHKYVGTGNDFVMVADPVAQWEYRLDRRLIARICDRHFGVGADGLILLQRTAGYDFRMVYYNADGGESTFCGNGSRCLVAFARQLGWIGEEAWFVASDGDHEARILGEGLVAVHMRSVREVRDHQGDLVLDSGSPHLVRTVPDAASADLLPLARAIRYAPPFAGEGINVNVMEPGADGLFVRTYERGVEGETLSCGTGVTASAIAWAHRQGLTGRHEIAVRTPGGNLSVSLEAGAYGYREVWLSGPALEVFRGSLDLHRMANEVNGTLKP